MHSDTLISDLTSKKKIEKGTPPRPKKVVFLQQGLMSTMVGMRMCT